jgi:hypothetical protein
VRIEGIETVPAGVRFQGSVTEAAPAKDAEGRGHMTLELESVQLPDGGRVSLKTRPLVLRAPSTKKKDVGIVGGLAAAGAVVGGLIGGKGGAFGEPWSAAGPAWRSSPRMTAARSRCPRAPT